MQLLVSVRSAVEALAAVAGGADIVDAKEPARGSLGPVDSAALRAIAEAVPDTMPLSVALGELRDPEDAARALATLDGIAVRPSELYVKVGLAGSRDPGRARAVLEAMIDAAGRAPLRPRVVAVGYADHERAVALPIAAVGRLAAEAGAQGVLLDTWGKDGRDAFAWAGPAVIRCWIHTCRAHGLLAAVAGSLSIEGVRAAARLGPDIVGVRGAACEGGRSGTVSAPRVGQLAAALRQGEPLDALA